MLLNESSVTKGACFQNEKTFFSITEMECGGQRTNLELVRCDLFTQQKAFVLMDDISGAICVIIYIQYHIITDIKKTVRSTRWICNLKKKESVRVCKGEYFFKVGSQIALVIMALCYHHVTMTPKTIFFWSHSHFLNAVASSRHMSPPVFVINESSESLSFPTVKFR